MDDIGYEIGWNDTIENDGPEWITLPEGDYDFKVTTFERARHTPSEGGKLPACNKAIVHLLIETPEGTTTIKHNLFLHSSTEGLLCAFFSAIGQRRKGEKINMNWNAVSGSKGRARIGVRTRTNDKGDTFTFNEVKKFYESEALSSPQNVGYEPGRF